MTNNPPPSTWTPPYGSWGGSDPAQPPAYAPPPPPRRSGLAIFVRILALCVLAVFVLVGVGIAVNSVRFARKDRAPLHTPEKVAGYPRMVTSGAATIEDQVTSGLGKMQDPQAGVYGRGGTPQYLLLAGFGFEANAREVLDGFRNGAGDVHATFGKVVTAPDGLVCQTVTMPNVRGAVCAWSGHRSNGAVIALRKADITSLARATTAARGVVDSH